MTTATYTARRTTSLRTERAAMPRARPAAVAWSGPALLPLMWLASPALPVDGFSYFEGLEAAVEGGRMPDEATMTLLCDTSTTARFRPERQSTELPLTPGRPPPNWRWPLNAPGWPGCGPNRPTAPASSASTARWRA